MSPDTPAGDRTLTQTQGLPPPGEAQRVIAPELAPGDRLGPWTLLSELGQGGMGRVMLAQRSDGLYQQRAAIKLLRGWGGEHALEQLARERQILASLSHPHIARLMDGGTTPAGHPYLVMEYVQGEPIDGYCRQRQLGVAAIFKLFEGVCGAVGYAHRQLVVHCDIKPGNILVGDDGRAMLLDFGIAQLLGKAGHEASALTPRYASPEQLAGLPATSASDVFSLGRTLEQLLRAIDPPAARADEWQAIVAMATATDPEQRYPGVPALVADLRRYRAQLPLVARVHRPAYVARKALRRHWPWALAAGAALGLGAFFVLRVVHERDRALQAEALARQEAATTRQVGDFMVLLFEGADPNVAGRSDLSAADVVNKGRQRIDSALQDQPALQVDMKYVLGKVYENIGRPRTAIELYEQAAALERTQSPSRPLREAAVLSRLAMALANDGQAARAVTTARASLALRQAHTQRLGPDAPELADSLNTLGWALARDGAQAEARTHLENALRIRRLHEASAPLELASTLHNLGLLGANSARAAEAEAHLRQAMALKLRQLDASHPSVMNTQQSLAVLLARTQRSDEALPLMRYLLAARRALHGSRSTKVSDSLNELGSMLQDAGRVSEAAAHYREALQIDESAAGHQSTTVAIRLNNLATALDDMGDPAAEANYRESLAIRQALLKSDDLSLARAQRNLGHWLQRAGRLAEARSWLDASATTRLAKLPPGHGEAADARIALAEWHLASGGLPEAEAHLAGVAGHEAALNPLRRAALKRAQAQLERARRQLPAALALQRQAIDLVTGDAGGEQPKLLPLRVELAEMLLQQDQRVLARQVLAAEQARLAALHPASPLRTRAQKVLRADAGKV
jgi:serine/threonine-protein kinase